MENKLVTNIGNKKIVAEILNWHDEFPNELCVYLCDENDRIIQDICLVREHYSCGVNSGVEINENVIDCMVWSDSNDDDYTHKFLIGVYEEEDDE